MEENKEIVKVFFYAMAHKRYEQGQFIGVDMNYAVKVMEILDVDNRRRCLNGIAKIINSIIEEKLV